MFSENVVMLLYRNIERAWNRSEIANSNIIVRSLRLLLKE